MYYHIGNHCAAEIERKANLEPSGIDDYSRVENSHLFKVNILNRDIIYNKFILITFYIIFFYYYLA